MKKRNLRGEENIWKKKKGAVAEEWDFSLCVASYLLLSWNLLSMEKMCCFFSQTVKIKVFGMSLFFMFSLWINFPLELSQR